MLDDTPRKLLRVIAQFRYHIRLMPTVRELAKLSGRKPADVIKGFKVLAAERYITWDVGTAIETAVIIEGWERNVSYDTAPLGGAHSPGRSTSIDYWLYH